MIRLYEYNYNEIKHPFFLREMILVIVESASKAKTIQGYLNRSSTLKDAQLEDFQVVASLGHVMDLPMKTMGVHLTTWVPEYTINETRKAIVEKLLQMGTKASRIYLAADPDREGEAIADHLATLFQRAKIPKDKLVRVAFNEITEEALVEAILNPRALNRDLIEAQETRRILDRVVGYESSPLLWRRFSTTQLSAGRVQSAALKMIVERYVAFTEHTYQHYWTLEGRFRLPSGGGGGGGGKKKTDDMELTARSIEPKEWGTEEAVMDELKTLTKKFQWTIELQQKTGHRRPPAPLTTSSMQQEAATKHGLPIAMTMQLAQELYEKGHITYMRTDSTALSKGAQTKILSWITETYGKEMTQGRIYKTKVANAQEAHEAIRPTDVTVRSADLEKMTPGHRKLYDLIWRRAVASQMKEATLIIIEYRITGTRAKDTHLYVFQGSDEVITELGYLSVLQPELKVVPEKLHELERLMSFGGNVEPLSFVFNGNVTRPEPLFMEPSLVKLLEKKGIGRPSTYAPTLKKLLSKGYVYKGAAPAHVDTVSHHRADWENGGWKKTQDEESLTVGGKETTALVPSSLGIRVIEYLNDILEKVVDSEFTAQMEKKLDEISRGEYSKKEMLDKFYKAFHQDIENAQAVQKEYAARAKAEATGIPEDKETKTELVPSNVLKPFETLGANVVQTRYGPALYVLKTKRFVSVTPLLQWRKKTLDELNQTDVRFLMRLPLTVEGTEMEIHLGRYGLYVKKNGESMKLSRECWDDIYKNTWTPELIQQHAVALSSTSSATKGARGAPYSSRSSGGRGGRGRRSE